MEIGSGWFVIGDVGLSFVEYDLCSGLSISLTE